jgi:hypothetical protein
MFSSAAMATTEASPATATAAMEVTAATVMSVGRGPIEATVGRPIGPPLLAREAIAAAVEVAARAEKPTPALFYF